MIGYRMILAGVIALAVALAPVAATWVVGVGARAASAAAAHDCHGKAAHSDGAQHGLRMAMHNSDKGDCPDCDSPGKAKCIGDGGKCCKLTGIVLELPAVMNPAEVVDLETNVPAMLGWQVRPPPPPPRA